MALPLTTVNRLTSVAGKHGERLWGETIRSETEEVRKRSTLGAIEHRCFAALAGYGDAPANRVERCRLQVVEPRRKLSDESAALGGEDSRNAVIACGDQEATIPAEADTPDHLTTGQGGDEVVRTNVPDPSRP